MSWSGDSGNDSVSELDRVISQMAVQLSVKKQKKKSSITKQWLYGEITSGKENDPKSLHCCVL